MNRSRGPVGAWDSGLNASVCSTASTRSSRQAKESLRQGYRQIRDELRHMGRSNPGGGPQAGPTAAQQLHRQMERAEGLIAEVESTQECVMDVMLFRDFAELCRTQAENINRRDEFQFNVPEFVAKLAASPVLNTTVSDQGVMQGGSANWLAWGRFIRPYFRPAPALRYLNGALPAGYTPMPGDKKRERAAKNKPGTATRVTLKVNAGRADGVDALVDRVWKTLKRERRRRNAPFIDLFAFVLDPESFGRTIENIFHVTFLVKERRAMLDFTGPGLPKIAPLDEAGHDSSGQPCPTQQVLLTLTWQDYEDLRQIYRLKKAVLDRPTDPPVNP